MYTYIYIYIYTFIQTKEFIYAWARDDESQCLTAPCSTCHFLCALCATALGASPSSGCTFHSSPHNCSITLLHCSLPCTCLGAPMLPLLNCLSSTCTCITSCTPQWWLPNLTSLHCFQCFVKLQSDSCNIDLILILKNSFY